MKRLLFIVVLLCLFTLPALAQGVTVNLAWDAMPAGQNWTNVRIYEKSGATYTLRATAAGTATTASVTGVLPGTHTYIARSVAGTLESPDSNAVDNDINPSAPSNFRIAVLEVDVGEDGTVTIKSVKLIPFDPGFFRTS